MRINKTREKLMRGEHVIGTFFHSGSSLVMDAIGLSGMDYVIIDKEHSPIAIETAADLIRTCEARDITPFVRIKEVSRSSVLKLLDLGAKGLIVPNLHSVDEVKKLIEWAKYKPIGDRGMAMGRGVDFGLGTDPDIWKHWANVNEQTMLMPMCETRELLENIEAVCAMDGVDGIFVGPCDLSISLDKPGEFFDPVVVDALKRITKACRDNGKFSLIFAPNAEMADKFVNEIGFDGVGSAIDVNLVLSGYLKLVKDLRNVM